MFKQLFSCFNDANHTNQVDLSGGTAPMPISSKPELPQDTNINVQQVNFEMDDFKHNNLL